MSYATVNPATGELLQEFSNHSFPDIEVSKNALRQWKQLSVEARMEHLMRVAALMKERSDSIAKLITLEMGKPLREAEYEVNKTLTAFDYYNENAARFLNSYEVKTFAEKSMVVYEPLGIIFSIMPWNFPFWQVFRFAVPTLAAGNVTILKHAPNVPQCAAAIEQLFVDAGLPNGVFKNYYLTNEDAGKLIAHKDVAGLSFTGSDVTGSVLAEQAGRNIKKVVMELGGNDAFIVLADADIDKAVAGALKSRSINAGQACNGAKRFMVAKEIVKEFTNKLIDGVHQLKVGNPMDEDTQIGPLARLDLADKVRKQIADSVREGAEAYYHSFKQNEKGNFVAPVVLTNVTVNVTSFKEEVFGPVFSVIEVRDFDEAIALANQSQYGLAASVWTGNKELALSRVGEIEAGNVFINDIVKSDARLPFGGVKRSGFGRELSEQGIKEFVNVKTVYVNG
jgi:succinate-semialdehyde dehydrogenase/glutarate-semialdehyde dehydrogenase